MTCSLPSRIPHARARQPDNYARSYLAWSLRTYPGPIRRCIYLLVQAYLALTTSQATIQNT